MGGNTLKNIVGIRFRRLGKIYFFNPQYLILRKDEFVIVDTEEGEEIGKVAIPNRTLDDEKVPKDLKRILRIANEKDLRHYKECQSKEKEAFSYCNKKIKEHGLKMNLIDVEFKFNHSKILFYFTADGRIDFRELVKDLAAVYRTRIELRQIGVRDEIKRLGGNGVCGRQLCCCSFLSNFETVSIKMAKDQNLSLNPSKISGNCGRLMCCLKYEDEVYQEKIARLPHIGAIVKTPDGVGEVEAVETLAERLKVKIKDGDVDTHKKYEMKDIKIIKDTQKEVIDEEEEIHKKELEELERMENEDKKGGEENYGI